MRYFCLAVCLALLAYVDDRRGAAAPVPKDEYLIKIKTNPDKGEIIVAHDIETMNMQVKITADDKVLKDEKKEKVKEEIYTETTLETGSSHAKKYKREYKKAEEREGEKTKKQPYAGRTVLFEEKDGKYQVTVEGKPDLPMADLGNLTRKANDKTDAEVNKAMLPNKAVKVGETWKLSGKALAKLGMEKMLDTEKSKGEGKLLKVYTRGGNRWGVLEYRLESVMKQEKGLVFESPTTMLVTMDLPIDGSSMLGKMSMQMKLKGQQVVEQNGKKFTVHTTVDMKATGARTAKE